MRARIFVPSYCRADQVFGSSVWRALAIHGGSEATHFDPESGCATSLGTMSEQTPDRLDSVRRDRGWWQSCAPVGRVLGGGNNRRFPASITSTSPSLGDGR